MKTGKRALRRYKSKCKFEKRLKLYVYQSMYIVTEQYNFTQLGGHEIELIRNDIRQGKYWTFLKDTSTSCSCYICSGDNYKRLSKSELNKLIDEQLD